MTADLVAVLQGAELFEGLEVFQGPFRAGR